MPESMYVIEGRKPGERNIDALKRAQNAQKLAYQQYIEQQKAEQSQSADSSGSMPSYSTVSNILDKFGIGGGGEASGGADTAGMLPGDGGSSGLGVGGYLGVILAAIAGQHMLSGATNRTVDGVETADAFSGHFGTEPWLAYLSNQWGNKPTAGEKFDAAMAKGDSQAIFKTLPAMGDYWADPARGGIDQVVEGLFGEDVKNIADPIQWILGRFGG